MRLCIAGMYARLVDRAGNIFQINLSVDGMDLSYAKELYWEGELVQDSETGKQLFIICDFLSGVETTVLDRLKKHRHLEGKTFLWDEESITIQFKKYYDLSEISTLAKMIDTNTQTYKDKTRQTKNDGIVFTPLHVKTTLEKHDPPILKWKPSHMLTLDCSMNYHGYIGVYNPQAGGFTNFTFRDELINLPNPPPKPGIIEIAYIPKKGWQFIRTRSDKVRANNLATCIEILTLQIDNLDLSELVKLFETK